MSFFDKDLQSIQEARIWMESMRDARDTLQSYSQETFDDIVQAVIAYLEQHGQKYVQQSVLETGYGNINDEYILLQRILQAFKDDYLPQKYLGILETNEKNRPLRVGVSLGIVCALLPAENMVAYAVYIILLCLKTGNALMVVPNDKALYTTNQLIQDVNDCCMEYGLPQNSIGCLHHVSTEGLQQVCNHAETDIIIDIGGQSDTIIQTNKPFIFGGIGGSAVFIEKSSKIDDACHAIVKSRSFDYGLLPGAEQYIVVEDSIVSEVRNSFLKQGAHFMSAYEEKQLLHYLQQNQKIIGKSVYEIAKSAGFVISENAKLLVSEQPYIFDENPFFNEMRFPIITFCCEPDWLHACEKCIQLLKEKKTGHTLAIHSQNHEIIQNFILKKPVGRIIVNAPSSFASMGYHSNLASSMILGGLTMKKGSVAHNITPNDLTYCRYVGYGEDLITNDENINKESHIEQTFIQLLKSLLQK